VTVGPPSQIVEVTQFAKLTTTVSGVGMEDFRYQWRHNGEDVKGETSDALIIDRVSMDHSGDYECVVSNKFGDTFTSNNSHLSKSCSLLSY